MGSLIKILLLFLVEKEINYKIKDLKNYFGAYIR